jgi:hypothetical protein
MLASREKPPPPGIILALGKDLLNELDDWVLVYEWTLSKG